MHFDYKGLDYYQSSTVEAAKTCKSLKQNLKMQPTKLDQLARTCYSKSI